jgi:hypothetical protein
VEYSLDVSKKKKRSKARQAAAAADADVKPVRSGGFVDLCGAHHPLRPRNSSDAATLAQGPRISRRKLFFISSRPFAPASVGPTRALSTSACSLTLRSSW